MEKQEFPKFNWLTVAKQANNLISEARARFDNRGSNDGEVEEVWVEG